MPPHCDTMDGPVVRAAMSALEAGDVTLVLPFVHKEGEEEVIAAFDKVMRAIETGSADVLIALLAETVRGQLGRRFDEVMHLKEQAPWSVDHARAYVKAML